MDKFIPGKFYRSRRGRKYRFVGEAPDAAPNCRLVFVNDVGSIVTRYLGGKFCISGDDGCDIIDPWPEPVKYRLYLYKFDYSSPAHVFISHPANYVSCVKQRGFRHWIGEEQEYVLS